MPDPYNPHKIPATIVTGFLGSGKTTLLRHILAHARGRRIAVIVNEFGEMGIDGEILRGCGVGCAEDGGERGGERAGELYELANGCLCCTVQESFYPVMRELMARRSDIDHILIETSGLALPKPLVQAFNWPEIRNGCTVDAVIAVVDTPAAAAGQFAENPQAVDVQRRQDPKLDHASPLHELFEDQLAAADLVILAKADLAGAGELARVEALVREEVPPEVKIVASRGGELDLALLLGLRRASEDGIDRRAGHHDHAHHSPGEAHEHGHDAFDSVVVKLPPVDREKLQGGLRTLVREHAILRVKGFAALPGKPMRLVVQGVGKRFESYFDRKWRPEETPGTRLVLIGQALPAETLRRALRAAVATPTATVKEKTERVEAA
jgi:cobalamin biosynthesis protein CobW